MSAPSKARTTRRPPGSRPLKVGETVRHALSRILQRGEVHDADLARHNVTITEVKMSPDLAHAHVFVAPLGGLQPEAMLAALKACAPRLRSAVARAVKLRHAPDLHFQLDTSFDYADRIERLLHDDAVARDLES